MNSFKKYLTEAKKSQVQQLKDEIRDIRIKIEDFSDKEIESLEKKTGVEYSGLSLAANYIKNSNSGSKARELDSLHRVRYWFTQWMKGDKSIAGDVKYNIKNAKEKYKGLDSD